MSMTVSLAILSNVLRHIFSFTINNFFITFARVVYPLFIFSFHFSYIIFFILGSVSFNMSSCDLFVLVQRILTFLPSIDDLAVVAYFTIYFTRSFSELCSDLTNFSILLCIESSIGCIPEIKGKRSLCVLSGIDQTLRMAMHQFFVTVSIFLLQSGHN